MTVRSGLNRLAEGGYDLMLFKIRPPLPPHRHL